MSNLFLKSEINDLLQFSITENDFKINNIKILNKNNDSINESSDINQQGGDTSVTSSFMGSTRNISDTSYSNQSAGNNSVTSSFMGSTRNISDTSYSNQSVVNNSVTSSFMGSTRNFSDTSYSNQNAGNNSVTSSFIGSTKVFSDTSDINQNGGNNSPTSTFKQLGGNYSPTSNNNTNANINNDIHNLVSMLTSDSNVNTINETTTTPQLEQRLRKLLKQEGGSQLSDIEYSEQVENKIYKLLKNKNVQQKGGSEIIKLGLAATGAYLAYHMITDTETDIVDKVVNKPIIPVSQPNENLSPTSETSALPPFDPEKTQNGGAKDNAGLVAFRTIAKLVATELGITYPKSLKIASALQTDVKENNKNKVTNDNLVQLATDHLKKNKQKYEKMIPV
jgi:hypothetical protein